jgi:phosphoribosyl-ATP pyrophosphohydrolase
MNYITKMIMDLCDVNKELAIEIQNEMGIDFSEATQNELINEIKYAFHLVRLKKKGLSIQDIMKELTK